MHAAPPAQEFRRSLDAVEKHFPADLDIRIVMDNASSHKTKLICDWFAICSVDNALHADILVMDQ